MYTVYTILMEMHPKLVKILMIKNEEVMDMEGIIITNNDKCVG